MASLASLLNPAEPDATPPPPPPRKGSLAPAQIPEPLHAASHAQQQSTDSSSTSANPTPATVDVSEPTLEHSTAIPPAIQDEPVRRQSHGSTGKTSTSHAGQVQSATQRQQSAPLENPPALPPAAVTSFTSTNLAPLTSQAATAADSVPPSATMEVEPPLQPSSQLDGQRVADADTHALKAVAALKSENSQRPQSPLRESSIPVPSTEDITKDEPSIPTKKRPAPAKTKKGTASTVKRDRAPPPAKKRKTESKRADTPSSRASKTAGKGASAKGTPINSSPAPSTRSYSAEPQEEQDYDDEEVDDEGRSQDGDLYCICRKPDNGQFMIGCDGTCDDWFHGKCVGIPERDRNLIDKYICPGCTTAGVGRTTWKRMCRRNGCRQPAKTGKSKTGASGSKYCSEECGVLYFRDMVAKTRGAEESASRRAARKKGSADSADKQDDDLGARGGALAAGEVKALLNASETVEEFRKLGDGVLSPPSTPDGKENNDEPEYTELEAQELARIEIEKEKARQRHNLLKDRMKFVTMAKQAASRVATERELKPKEYCGYDPRIEWSEQRFQIWRNGPSGQQAFELNTLATEKVEDAKDMSDDGEDATPEICDRKKCARHMEWSKLAVDDLRFEMSDNGDRMRLLDRDEHDIKERAALRSKTGGAHDEGSVELHGAETAVAALPEAEEVAADSNGAAGSPEVVPTVEEVEPVAVDVT